MERLAGPALSADLLPRPGTRLRRPRSVKVLSLGFDLGPVLAAVEQGGPLDAPPFRPTLVAVARGHYRVAVHVLPDWRHAWLEALGEEGADVHAAAARAAQASDRQAGAVIADLAPWLPLAAGQGLVAA